MKESFISILEKEQRDKITPFLKTLSADHKMELVPVIKKLGKEYLAFQYVMEGKAARVQRKANDEQEVILLLSAFVCFSRADFERFEIHASIVNEKVLNEVLDWYCPEWFSDFVNGQAYEEWLTHRISYSEMLALMDKGYLRPSPELIVTLLPTAIYNKEGRATYFSPNNLLAHPITLTEHVWMLFQFESNIYYAGRWMKDVTGRPKEDENSGWMPVFRQFINEGRLDRQRVLQECLYACNRNFNKLASGWFIGLFEALAPTQQELLSLQKELFAVLGSPQSKPVNTALSYVKKLMPDKQVMLSGFLDYVPVLLSSSTKSIVAATLGILEKMPADKPGDGLLISRAVLQVFVQTDDGLQERAAKIILAHKTTAGELLKDELPAFASSMTASARRLLGELLEAQPEVSTASSVVGELLPATPVALTPIPAIETIDDLVFLVSQSLDNRHAWLIDIMPVALADWMPALQGAAIARLEPGLQRALKMMKNGPNVSQGDLDSMLAVFLIDVCLWLVRQRGSDAEVLNKLFNAYKQERDGKPVYWQSIGEGTYMASWDAERKDDIYLHHKHLLVLALTRIVQEQKPLPMLCTPTHEPGWIMPEVLVNRLLVYQQAEEWPDETDLQVAVFRCYLEDTTGAIALAEEKLRGEYLQLCLFLFGKYAEPPGPFEHPAAWLAASVALPEKKQYPALEKFGFYEFPFSWYTGQRSWEVVKGDLKIEYLKERKKPPVLLYDLFRFEHHYYGNETNDFLRLLLLSPSNPEPLLALVSRESLKYSTFCEASANKAVIALLQGLHEIWGRPGNMAHVFVGACMLCGDKTTAGIAAEIWLKQAPVARIDSAYLGKVIGVHERANYAPLKRFTDLVHQRLLRVSTQHNELLQVLIEHVLQELPDEPVTNLKKLLEIYLELLDLNKAGIGSDLLPGKLHAWQKNASVKKITSQLITFSA